MGEAGRHFVTYRTADEAIEIVRYYLAHDDERATIAAEGQRHVFAHHTYGQRLAQIIATVAAHRDVRSPARHALARVEAVWRSECMMHQGARPGSVGRLLLEGNLSAPLLRNAATAAARGIVRPLRQAMAARQVAARK